MNLIDKDAVIAEIKRRRDLHYKYYVKHGVGSIAEYKYDEDREILSFIDTLEVKEVDLDFQHFAKEMAEVFALPSSITKNTEEEPLNWEYAIAKHFFELGVKAKG